MLQVKCAGAGWAFATIPADQRGHNKPNMCMDDRQRAEPPYSPQPATPRRAARRRSRWASDRGICVVGERCPPRPGQPDPFLGQACGNSPSRQTIISSRRIHVEGPVPNPSVTSRTRRAGPLGWGLVGGRSPPLDVIHNVLMPVFLLGMSTATSAQFTEAIRARKCRQAERAYHPFPPLVQPTSSRGRRTQPELDHWTTVEPN